jgi:uncharacterized protein (TIGR02145 family)
VFGIDSDAFKDSEDMSIFGTSDGDAALLAVSILLLGDLSEADFTQRLMNFSQAIKTGGAWNNEEAKKAMADWASEANLNKIKSNVLSWELSGEVPAFEKYVYDYWVAIYGLGDCGSSNEGNIKISINEKKCICKYGNWQTPLNYIDMKCFESGSCQTFTDIRDNRRYAYTVIGEQVWMAENLDYSANGSVCYNNSQINCNKYGRLYDWATAMDVCPEGWHLPSDDEWSVLIARGARSLKATSGWTDFDGISSNGNDSYGFAALPCGNVSSSGDFEGACDSKEWCFGTWWSSDEKDDTTSLNLMLRQQSMNVYMQSDSKSSLRSVRCLKD